MDRRDFVVGATAVGANLIRPAKHAERTLVGADVLLALDPPSPGTSVYEPHIAIDQSAPDRIAVAAQYGIRGGRGGRNIQLWISENAGRTWFATRVPRPKLDGEFAADALVGFHADGGLLVTSNFGAKWVSDWNDGRSWPRLSAPPIDQMLAFTGKTPPPADLLTRGGIAVSRTGDSGRTLAATIIPGISPGADKTAVAFDRFEGSPRRGTVYVAWSDQIPSVHVARSTDGGRTFDLPAVLKTRTGAAMHQITVRPDGSVHSMWTHGAMPGITNLGGQNDGGQDGGRSIYHAVSRDGGATFSEPNVVGSHAGAGMVGLPSLAVDAKGVMLWIWGQSDAVPDSAARPIVQARHRLYAIRSEDGTAWSAPFELCPWAPAGTHMGLPAVTSHGTRWWILTYLADSKETRVALLRSDDGGKRFELDRVLAKRPFAADEISLMGSYLARFCDDIPQIGDYVGVSASGSRVASAFVLPETNSPTSRATVYVALSKVR